jgi:hypothetical protein
VCTVYAFIHILYAGKAAEEAGRAGGVAPSSGRALLPHARLPLLSEGGTCACVLCGDAAPTAVCRTQRPMPS